MHAAINKAIYGCLTIFKGLKWRFNVTLFYKRRKKVTNQCTSCPSAEQMVVQIIDMVRHLSIWKYDFPCSPDASFIGCLFTSDYRDTKTSMKYWNGRFGWQPNWRYPQLQANSMGKMKNKILSIWCIDISDWQIRTCMVLTDVTHRGFPSKKLVKCFDDVEEELVQVFKMIEDWYVVKWL